MMMLFRLVEPDAPPSGVEIDGVDILRLPLHTLRSRLTIIPQDAFLVGGTVRYNLDPTGAASDDDMRLALDRAQMAETVARLGGLEALIEEGGANMSQGQRQLLCIARAVLRRPRVLVLDEPTASVDVATDAALQRVLRSAFPGVTMLTIAHRIDTILDSDRVLVLDAGRVVEFDAPEALLRDPTSAFAQLVHRSRQSH